MARIVTFVGFALAAGLVVGSVLVSLFWDGGTPTGLSEALWRIGGLMVYLCLAGALLIAVAIAVAMVVSGVRRVWRAAHG